MTRRIRQAELPVFRGKYILARNIRTAHGRYIQSFVCYNIHQYRKLFSDYHKASKDLRIPSSGIGSIPTISAAFSLFSATSFMNGKVRTSLML
jgi:hypothetical protein